MVGKSSDEAPFVLQAVVLADSPEPRFRPVTLEKPRVSYYRFFPGPFMHVAFIHRVFDMSLVLAAAGQRSHD